ncbi:MAG: hypothetical protein IPI95_00645 [Flavobacteriales bacterium]|nr:hypothetical protein [Flavobacteriales bacterium]
MSRKTGMAISGLVLAAAVGTYLFVGVDLTPHEEYVELQTVAADTLPAPPSAYGIPLELPCGTGPSEVRIQLQPAIGTVGDQCCHH